MGRGARGKEGARAAGRGHVPRPRRRALEERSGDGPAGLDEPLPRPDPVPWKEIGGNGLNCWSNYYGNNVGVNGGSIESRGSGNRELEDVCIVYDVVYDIVYDVVYDIQHRAIYDLNGKCKEVGRCWR